MRQNLANWVIGGLLCISLGCSTSRNIPVANLQVDQLMKLMTGSFDSSSQAARDTNYFDISLHMYPIWKDRGAWLYVEQALSARQDAPYRQRIYHLESMGEGRVRSVVYTLPDPKAFIGAWKTPQSFEELNPLDLSLRGGCDVILARINKNRYEGSTEGKSCESSLGGASYASSKVFIRRDRIESWDQGWDIKDQQVWGAETGAYVFMRK